jgi:hypothetical protein
VEHFLPAYGAQENGRFPRNTVRLHTLIRYPKCAGGMPRARASKSIAAAFCGENEKFAAFLELLKKSSALILALW